MVGNLVGLQRIRFPILSKARAYYRQPAESQKSAKTEPLQPFATPSQLDKEERLKSFRKAVLAWSDSECQILVFGSYANGQYRLFSDIDVAVISEKFKGQGWQQRIAKLMEFLPENSVLIKPIGITPDEKTKFDYPSIIRTVRSGPTRDITVWI